MGLTKQTVRLIYLFVVAFGLFAVIGALLFFEPPEGNRDMLKILIGALITAFITAIGAKE